MSDDPMFVTTDKMLAAMQFASERAAQEERHRRGMARLLLGMLEVLDALQALEARCLDLVEQGHVVIPATTIQVLAKQMMRELVEVGVVPLDVSGKPLDLDHQEVVGVRRAPEIADDIVLDEVQRGYLWKGAVLRRARVVVSGPREDPPAESGVQS